MPPIGKSNLSGPLPGASQTESSVCGERACIRGLVLFITLLALSSAVCVGAINVVDVYPATFQHKIGDELAGANVVYSWEKDSFWAGNTVRSNLVDLGVAFIRYPGGEVADFYHWQNPNGLGWTDSWAVNSTVDATNWMSLGEYMAHVDATGAQPLLGINVDSGHVYSNRLQEAIAEATNMVSYALTNGYAVKNWFIGNESYHDSPRSPTGSTNPMMTVTQYANYINQYANAMRAVDPEIKIVANWNNSWSSQYTTLLNLAGTNIDMLDIHCYWNYDHATWSNWISEMPMQHGGISYQAKFEQFRTNLDTRGYTNIQIGMLEYNRGPHSTSPSAPDLPGRYQTALMNSEILLQSVEGGLDAGCLWPMTPPGDDPDTENKAVFGTNSSHTPNPVFYPLKWFGAVSGQHSVRSTNSWAGTYTTAALNPIENVLTTFILRKAQFEALIELDSHGFGDSTNASIQTFQASGGILTSDVSQIVNPPFTNIAGGKIQFTVPPWSLTRVTITKPACHIECGLVTTNGVNSATWRSVAFANAFQRPPVVLCSPLTANDAEPGLVRVRNITASGFEYRLAEWDYQDSVHVTETFQWLAVPEGVHDINGEIWEAGVIESDQQRLKADRLKHKSAQAPLLFYQVYQPANSTVAPRVQSLQSNRFELHLVSEMAHSSNRVFEKVGYLALPWNPNGTLPDGRRYMAISTGDVVGTNWLQKNFSSPMTNHCFIAALQGAVNDDYGCTLRYANFTDTSVKLKVDEENSTGTNTLAHAPENVALLVLGADAHTGIHTTGIFPTDQNRLATNGVITLQFDAALAADAASNLTVWSKGYPGLYTTANCQQIAGRWVITNNSNMALYQAIFTPDAPFSPGDLVIAHLAAELASTRRRPFRSREAVLVSRGRWQPLRVGRNLHQSLQT